MKKILVIEDELAYSKLLGVQLTQKGYEVLLADDGEKGLALIKKEKPDLVLLDIRMPKMDGMTMLDLLRKDESIKTTKVVMLTNLEPDDKILGKIVEDTPSYYFVKSDIRFNDLLTKIKELLGE